jgi:hypothetical protein
MEIPDGLNDRATALWVEVTSDYDLDAHESALLHEICRTMCDLDTLAAQIERTGHTVAGRVNPALTEARQLRLVFARLVAALRLPTGDEDDSSRPQRRVGVRGSYSL